MNARPLILVTPSTESKGAEFADRSMSLSARYTKALADAGGLPVILPCHSDAALIQGWLDRCDGVMLTGGDDLNPRLYQGKLPSNLARTVGPVDDERDTLELELVRQALAARKPMFAICRGHQLLNVALGGDLIVDIPTQSNTKLNHRRMDAKTRPVHDIAVEPGSLLARATGETTLGVNSTHHQAVGRVADDLQVTARGPDGIVEALEFKKSNRASYLLAMQFHPERLYDRHPPFARMFKHFIAACRRGKATSS